MRVLVSCGEASGDLLASGVVRALRALDPSLEAFGIGGAKCREAGVDTRWDVSRLSVMGIAEVLPKLASILRLMRDIAETAARERPDVALLVDAPDFNLRLAKRLKRHGIRVVYFVSPSVWAWRSGRVKQIRRDVDEMCCILPFEEGWYRQRGVQATFVGHPLVELDPPVEEVAAVRRSLVGDGRGPLLALLPGSRRFEVRNLLPDMLGAAKRLAAEDPGLEVVVPVAPTIDRAWLESLGDAVGFSPKFVDGRARTVLQAADAALVASGTATLEATLAQVPTVIAYRASWLTRLVFELFVRAPNIGLPNILAGRRIVPEVLQHDVRPDVLAERVRPLLADTPERRAMVASLAEVRASLGTPGASGRVAQVVLGQALPRSAAMPSLAR